MKKLPVEEEEKMMRGNMVKPITYFQITKGYFKDSRKEIEKEFADYTGLNCCFTYSGRAALYLTFKSLGIKEGDIVKCCGSRPRWRRTSMGYR